MNSFEHELTYPLGDTLPAAGETIEVGPNANELTPSANELTPSVKWIRMGLPFALNHINLWLLRDEMDGPHGKTQGWTIVDCCIDKPESRAQWQQIFDTQLRGLPILRVICTHMHPDHIGLAHWLCDKWKVPLWISSTDYNAARNASTSSTNFGGQAAADFYASHGLTDPDSVAKIKARTGYYPSLVPAVPNSYHRIMDGDIVNVGGKDWRCISGYGHAPEHIALYCEDLNTLISGDMVLPRISTNVSVFDLEPEGDPLKLFLNSIKKYLHLPADTLVLPSHGKPFTGMHRRIAQLQTHHADRLAEVMQACSQQPTSGADIVPIMFKRELDLHQMTFAMGEAVAHLHMLWYEDKLVRQLCADGIYRFRAKTAL